MKWLLNLGAECRQNLLSGSFYTQLAAAEHPDDVRGWVRQLYYQSSDFTAALAMRYTMLPGLSVSIMLRTARHRGSRPRLAAARLTVLVSIDSGMNY
jgi:hypothetical protein